MNIETNWKCSRRWAWVALLMAPLLGCHSTPPQSIELPEQANLQTVYAGLGTSGRTFTLHPAQSDIRIYVFRGGKAPRLGHNHVLSAPTFTGFFHLPSAGTGHARFSLEFRLDQLAIDRPDHRAELGPAFASELTDDDRQGTRDHMLGNDNLQASSFPWLRIDSRRIVGEGTRFAALISVELHGQQREMWVPLKVDGLPEHLSVTGSLVLRQSDFGVKPYSVLGGLLAVQDEVVVEFRLNGG